MKSDVVRLMLIVGIVCLISGVLIQRGVYERDLRNLAYYESTYLSKTGWTTGYGSYNLRSFDGGINWYAVEYGDGKGFKVLGPADEVFPGLLERLEAMDNLIKYVEENGPITLSGPNASGEIEIMEAAGLSVESQTQ